MTLKWIKIMVIITSILQTVDVQMMFHAPQPMFMVPPPQQVGVPVPFPVPMPVIVTQKTTTTTTKAPNENNNNNGIMVIGGNPFAPPLIVMPVPQSNVRKVEYDESSREDSSSDDASDSSDSSRSSFMLRKRGKRRHVRVKRLHKRHHLRGANHGQKHSENHQKMHRSKRNSRFGDPDFIKPVLTYLSKHGNVKFKTRISGDDAARLMGKKEMHSDDEESSDSIQIRSPKEISGLRLIQSTERTRGIGTLPDRRVGNISVSYRLY